MQNLQNLQNLQNIGFSGRYSIKTTVFVLDYLLNYYSLDSSTTLVDSCGINNGFLFNVTSDVNGIINGCYEFNGTSSFAYIRNFVTPTDKLTLSFWFKRGTGSSVEEQMISKWSLQSGGDAQFMANIRTDGSLRFFISKDGGTVNWDVFTTDTGGFNDGEWHHYLGGYKADGVSRPKIFVDGVDLSGTNIGSPQKNINYVKDNINFGRGRSGIPYYDGKLDEIGILNCKPTQELADYLYNGGKGRPFSDFETSNKD